MLKEGFNADNITVIDTNEENLKFIRSYNVKTVKADLSKNNDWKSEIKNADYVINLAAQFSSPEI